MLEYEPLKIFFLLLKIKNTLLEHWLDSSGWQITKAMHDLMFLKVVFIISKTNYVVVVIDKVTIVDLQQWINIHICVMKKWQHVLILLTFKKVELGATLNNIKTMILDSMATYGGFSNDNMSSKWICFGCDDDLVLQGIWVCMITQTQEQLALYLFSVHYVTHQMNLDILVLSKLSLVMHIKSMLQFCMFFSTQPQEGFGICESYQDIGKQKV